MPNINYREYTAQNNVFRLFCKCPYLNFGFQLVLNSTCFFSFLYIYEYLSKVRKMKKNCWEVKNCGREVNGAKSIDLGVCIAVTESRLNGVHDGQNAGRSCWVVAGTLCGGKPQGTFAQKE